LALKGDVKGAKAAVEKMATVEGGDVPRGSAILFRALRQNLYAILWQVADTVFLIYLFRQLAGGG